MSRSRALSIVTLLALAAITPAMAAEEAPHAYTRDDLDRMFGPAPKHSSVSVDQNSAQDWAYVQKFIDSQYARIDADRQHEPSRDAGSSHESDPWSYTGAALWYPGYYGAYGYSGGYRSGWRGNRQGGSSVRGPFRSGGMPHPSPHGGDKGGFQMRGSSSGHAGGHGGRR